MAKKKRTDSEAFEVPEGYVLRRESKTKRLQLLVTPTISTKLKSRAAQDGISVNELCTRIFEKYLNV